MGVEQSFASALLSLRAMVVSNQLLVYFKVGCSCFCFIFYKITPFYILFQTDNSVSSLFFHHFQGRSEVPRQPLPPRPPLQPQPGISLLPSRPRIQPPRHRTPLQPPQLRPLPRPVLPGTGALPGTTGIILETGEAGPPGTVLMSGRGRLRQVDGQAGQSTVPTAEGYAGAPGESSRPTGRGQVTWTYLVVLEGWRQGPACRGCPV